MEQWDELREFQPHITRMITNSIKKNRLAHAYLLSGGKGVGKREFGTMMAKSFFCLNKQDGYAPCNECINCKRISHGNHPDFHVVEPEEASIKKEQIRYIQEEFSKTGLESRRKVVMIVHADKMSSGAANSLLKTLEEPIADVLIMLVTERKSAILPTIQSRCQLLSFLPLPKEEMLDKLEEQGINKTIGRLILELTQDETEANELGNDEWFAKARNIVIQLYESIKISKEEAFVQIQTQWIPHFEARDREKNGLGLHMLFLLYRDILLLKMGQVDHIVYTDCLELFHSYKENESTSQILQSMKNILHIKTRIQQNANIQLQLEHLILQILEV